MLNKSKTVKELERHVLVAEEIIAGQEEALDFHNKQLLERDKTIDEFQKERQQQYEERLAVEKQHTKQLAAAARHAEYWQMKSVELRHCIAEFEQEVAELEFELEEEKERGISTPRV